MTTRNAGKKKRAITAIFEICKSENKFEFHNDLVKKKSQEVGLANQFDVTKLDSKNKLPQLVLDENYAIIHLGSGWHKFIKGVENVYHTFEENDEIIEWQYKKSILNLFNTSESNILSIANNQRILHHFLYGKDTELDDVCIKKRPKTYFPHRTKTSFAYSFGDLEVKLDNMQIEVDLTIEFQGTIGIFECKNGKPKDFSIYQLYHPFLYYWQAKEEGKFDGSIEGIVCVYVVRQSIQRVNYIKLWAYTFTDPRNIKSIQLIKARTYKLVKQD